MKSFISLGKNPLSATVGVLVLMFGLASILYDGFFSLRVVANLFTDGSFLGITALGMTVVILSRGIDLSVGSVIGFTTVFVAWLVQDIGLATPAAWGLALAVGTAFGAFMGLLIVVYELPAFLVTLGGLFFAKGMGYVVSGISISINNGFYDAALGINLKIAKGAYLSVGALTFILFFAIVTYLLGWTRFGRYVYAVGGNEDSARLMGLPVDRVKVGVYAFNGFCSALAGIVMTLYMVSGNPLTGIGMELKAITAVVIGGTLLNGGVGGAVGTLLGVLILGVIEAIMNFDGGFDPAVRPISVGVLLLLFILLQRFLARHRDE